MLRGTWYLISAAAGIWLAVRGAEWAVAHAMGKTFQFAFTAETVPMLLPLSMVGGLLGVFFGGVILPTRR
jgi:hypothetical protein